MLPESSFFGELKLLHYLLFAYFRFKFCLLTRLVLISKPEGSVVFVHSLPYSWKVFFFICSTLLHDFGSKEPVIVYLIWELKKKVLSISSVLMGPELGQQNILIHHGFLHLNLWVKRSLHIAEPSFQLR